MLVTMMEQIHDKHGGDQQKREDEVRRLRQAALTQILPSTFECEQSRAAAAA